MHRQPSRVSDVGCARPTSETRMRPWKMTAAEAVLQSRRVVMPEWRLKEYWASRCEATGAGQLRFRRRRKVI